MSDFALSIHVSGIVQGVGFRPFVFRAARARNVRGWVLNGVDGVRVHAEGAERDVDAFVLALANEAPAAAHVSQIDLDEVPAVGFADFQIRFSDDAAAERATLVSPDLATCDECERELFDPADRRFRYPFINCTNCGPRFTIIRSLPYDRANTSMAGFQMCPECAAEYADPANRRFHAQPDACWECGPHVGCAVLPSSEPADAAAGSGGASGPCSGLGALAEWVWARDRESSDAIIARAVEVLRAGGVVAVKGLGGYQLCCDADDPRAIVRLRERKRRPGKALACLVRTVDDARERCLVSDEEARLLRSPARPIVLLRKRPDAALARGLADGLPELGVMLPSTPLQHLLLHDFGGMLVATSGNVHGDPIVIDDEEALTQLGGICDLVLGHDRPILSRYDDSVARVLDLGPAGTSVQMIRRARGYAPLPVGLPDADASDAAAADPAGAAAAGPAGAASAEGAAACIFATGAEQKTTLCLTRPGEAFVSQHLGDLENPAVFDAWLQAKATYEHLLRLRPAVAARDLHPEYLSSKWADSPEAPGEVLEVQHHHAHIAAVLGENNLEGPVLGLAFDGTGFGWDGAIWGGEALLANTRDYERFANLAYFPLPGGAAAIQHPLRAAYGLLWACDLQEHPAARDALAALDMPVDVLEQMIDRGLNTPSTSSMGRLFDAVSALLGTCTHPSYEGEAAILLDAAAELGVADGAAGAEADARYEFALAKNVAVEGSTAHDTSVLLIDPAPVLQAVLDDLLAQVPAPVIALRFHRAIVRLVVALAQVAQALYGIETVAMGGGVFMNRYLVEHTTCELAEAGFTVALNRDLPPNDGCISYGQAVVAAARLAYEAAADAATDVGPSEPKAC